MGVQSLACRGCVLLLFLGGFPLSQDRAAPASYSPSTAIISSTPSQGSLPLVSGEKTGADRTVQALPYLPGLTPSGAAGTGVVDEWCAANLPPQRVDSPQCRTRGLPRAPPAILA